MVARMLALTGATLALTPAAAALARPQNGPILWSVSIAAGGGDGGSDQIDAVSTAGRSRTLQRCDGNNAAQISCGKWDNLALSPDGTRLAWDQPNDPTADAPHQVVALAAPDGSAATVLGTDTVSDSQPSFSPTGARLVFIRGDYTAPPSTPSAIVTSEISGGTVRTITSRFLATAPEFTPNGRRILFLNHTGTEARPAVSLWSISVSGAGARRLIPNAARFDVAPNGTIAFVNVNNGNLYTAAANGRHKHLVTHCPPGMDEIDQPRFSPDGRQIAFTADDFLADVPNPVSGVRLYLIRPGGRARVLAANDDSRANVVGIAWGPRHRAAVT